MNVKEVIKKYKYLLQEDKYDELFSKCSKEEKDLLLDFLYNTVGINVLQFMTTVPETFFMNSNITKISIPDNIITIGNHAFLSSNVEEVYIPDSVKDMGLGVFDDCRNLVRVRLSNSLEKIPNNTFKDCINLQKVYIPDSVTLIGQDAFSNCSPNLLIIANYRTSENDKLKFLGSDMDFYKQHLKFKRGGVS